MENLSELATIYPNVKILHFHVDIRNNRLDFKVEISGFLFIYSSFFTLLLFLFFFSFTPMTGSLIYLLSLNSRMVQDMYHIMVFY